MLVYGRLKFPSGFHLGRFVLPIHPTSPCSPCYSHCIPIPVPAFRYHYTFRFRSDSGLTHGQSNEDGGRTSWLFGGRYGVDKTFLRCPIPLLTICGHSQRDLCRVAN
ncbi:hypothetical protein ZOSMA_209G00040 [Zostera marina]|uniref:Uncharacterized protein n=1 Tax=Zostera marina TaxID=29655 RepID=A0A0K9PL41_ZOSMR|nr:hypothetical protein ZOSMA_209G00040 [Zostera marina]